MQWLIVFFACGGLALIDRWLKSLALRGLTHDFGFGQFVLFKNDALVFSWPAPNMVAIWLMIAAMVIVLFIMARSEQRGNFLGAFACFLILTGAGSNLFDRIHYGYVIDWAYLGRWWPVFNLADVMIGVGILMFIFFRPRLRKTRELTKVI